MRPPLPPPTRTPPPHLIFFGGSSCAAGRTEPRGTRRAAGIPGAQPIGRFVADVDGCGRLDDQRCRRQRPRTAAATLAGGSGGNGPSDGRRRRQQRQQFVVFKSEEIQLWTGELYIVCFGEGGVDWGEAECPRIMVAPFLNGLAIHTHTHRHGLTHTHTN